jgi:hypothetical protein
MAKKETIKKEAIELEAGKSYKIKSTGKSEHMPKDEIYEVGNEVAEYLVNNGHATLI